MASSVLLLEENYEFIFSTELASRLHHTSNTWYKIIVSNGGLLFGWFLDTKDRSSEAVLTVPGSMSVMYNVPKSPMVRREPNGHSPGNSHILQSHTAGQGRSKHLRRLKGHIYTSWRSTDCLLSSSSYQGACPSLHCRGGATIWVRINRHIKGEPPSFCAAGRACM